MRNDVVCDGDVRVVDVNMFVLHDNIRSLAFWICSFNGSNCTSSTGFSLGAWTWSCPGG